MDVVEEASDGSLWVSSCKVGRKGVAGRTNLALFLEFPMAEELLEAGYAETVSKNATAGT